MEARDAEKYFRSELEKDPESPLTNLGLAIALKEKSEYSKSIEHFKRSIEEGLPDPLPALRLLSEAYQLQGKDKEAINTLRKALELNDKDKSTLFMLASSYQNSEEYIKASEIYEKLTFMEPVKNDVYYNLGITYGRQDNLGLAHYNFGIYYKKTNRIQEARFHFEKAREYSGDNPKLQEKIKKAMEDTREKKPGGRDGTPPDDSP
jgi:tetratricopeptide (TPR) repeat protein